MDTNRRQSLTGPQQELLAAFIRFADQSGRFQTTGSLWRRAGRALIEKQLILDLGDGLIEITAQGREAAR